MDVFNLNSMIIINEDGLKNCDHLFSIFFDYFKNKLPNKISICDLVLHFQTF